MWLCRRARAKKDIEIGTTEHVRVLYEAEGQEQMGEEREWMVERDSETRETARTAAREEEYPGGNDDRRQDGGANRPIAMDAWIVRKEGVRP